MLDTTTQILSLQDIRQLPHYVPFKYFLAIYYEQNGFHIQPHQVKVADWLEESLDEPKRLLFGCRGLGKSDIISCFVAWLLTMDIHRSIMIVSANKDVVHNNQRQIQSLFEDNTMHPLCSDISLRLAIGGDPNMQPNTYESYDAGTPRVRAKKIWTKERMVIPGSRVREYNVFIKTMGAANTGGRADHVIFDDLEAYENVRTLEAREKLKSFIGTISFMTKRTTTYIGTPWHEDSVYRQLTMTLPKKAQFVLPFDEKNNWWPEHYTDSYIQNIKDTAGEHGFRTQMLLKFETKSVGKLDPNFLKTYKKEYKVNKGFSFGSMEDTYDHFIGDTPIRDIVCYWDSAKGTKHGDNSVLAIVAMDQQNNYYIHRLVVLPEATHERGYDPQFSVMLRHLEHLRISTVYVEEFGHSMLHAEFEKYARELDKPLRCYPVTRSGKGRKDIFIEKRIEPALNHGKLRIHKSIDRRLINFEMNEFPSAGSPDDCLDAIAGCIEYLTNPIHPVRLPSHESEIRKVQTIGQINLDS